MYNWPIKEWLDLSPRTRLIIKYRNNFFYCNKTCADCVKKHRCVEIFSDTPTAIVLWDEEKCLH